MRECPLVHVPSAWSKRSRGRAVSVGESGWAVTSQSPGDPGFQATRYWRGPVWPILNWVLQRGLDRYGFASLAAEVRVALVELARGSGFYEHYSPVTGRGHGGEQFAWTAALILDLMLENGVAPGSASRPRIEH